MSESNLAIDLRGAVIVAGQEHAKEVSELRLSEYNRAKEFKVMDPERLAFGFEDMNHIVLLAVNLDGAPVATMRGGICRTKEELHDRLEVSVPSDLVDFPSLYLQRAATCSTVRRLGLNSVLRFWFFKLAVEAGAKSVSGTVNTGAERTRVMQRLGYEVFGRGLLDHAGLRDNVALNLAVLNFGDASAKSLNILRNICGDAISQFPLVESIGSIQNMDQDPPGNHELHEEKSSKYLHLLAKQLLASDQSLLSAPVENYTT